MNRPMLESYQREYSLYKLVVWLTGLYYCYQWWYDPSTGWSSAETCPPV